MKWIFKTGQALFTAYLITDLTKVLEQFQKIEVWL